MATENQFSGNFQEFIQSQAEPIHISQEIYKILSHQEYKTQMTKQLQNISQSMQQTEDDNDFLLKLTKIIEAT